MNLKIAIVFALTGAIFLGAAALPAHAQTLAQPLTPPKLASHRAVYDLSMARADVTGAIADVRGQMALEFLDVCDGYTLTQRMRMELIGAEGETTASDYSVASWESADGLKYRFLIRNTSPGQTLAEFEGTAQLTGPGKRGAVAFSKPAGQTLELPAGVIFPTEHTVLLLRAAGSGQKMVLARVFDGDPKDGVNDVSGFIGREIPPAKAPPAAAAAELAKFRSWRGSLAYFPINATSELPDYELGFRLFDNGIGDELVFDYGDFAVSARISLLELPQAPTC